MENSCPQPRRWWKRLPARLSVRTLMILILVIGVMLAQIIFPALAQRDAVDAIRREGGYIQYDWQRLELAIKPTPPRNILWLRDLLGPDFFETAIIVALVKAPDDRLMARVGKLDHLEVLTVSVATPARLSPQGMAEIRNLKCLQQLTVTPGGDARGFLPHLEGMEELRSLSWSSTVVTEADLVAIARLSQLEYLSIDGTHLTEAKLMHLAKLKDLRALNVVGPAPAVDWEVRRRFIKAMPNLESFMLDQRVFINKR